MTRSLKVLLVFYVLIVIAYVAQSIQRYGKALIAPTGVASMAHLNYNVFSFAPFTSTSDSPASFYRGNLQRWGQFSGEIPNPISETKILEALNVGIHPAAKSSVITNSKFAYVGSDTGWFYAVRLSDLSVAWKLYVPSSRRGLHSNATADESHVWIGDYAGRLYCFEAESGKLIWMRQLGQAIGGSPAISGDHLYVNPENYPVDASIAKLEKKTGKILWKSEPYGEQSHSSPAIDLESKLVVVGSNNSKLFAFSSEDGRTIWVKNLKSEVKGAPVIFEKRIYVATYLGEVTVLDLISGREIRAESTGKKIMSSPALDDKSRAFYVTDFTSIHKYDLDGKKIATLSLGNQRSKAAPVLIRGKVRDEILAVCDDVKICRVDLNLKSAVRLYEAQSYISSTPHLENGRIWTTQEEGPLLVWGPK